MIDTDKIAEKIANEEIEDMAEEQNHCPQHVIDERKVEEAIMRMKDQAQWEMYNNEMWNWSGLR
jgi:DNA replicative helicase MCM subunit Mcm2 (Cdc46/Mcm family)